ncbi:YigZ family protein [Anaerovorax odorimutans]|uniref:YigZ family protein n=1 Tax=Anaerovorax odorimutans TaxID=109327 RepID=UPI0004240674|nr:YigZ family protein [Anaerovorax odorimutans]
MILYKTVLDEGMAEQIIEKSRFIAHVKHVETKDEAESFFSEIKTKHKSATHNVPAYVIGDKFQLQWASDDGEPQGTSGAPIIQMLVKEGITNVAVIVTRYFGGIKLGTGGLVRAYTGTAKLVLDEVGKYSAKEMMTLTVKIDYTYHGKIQNMAENNDFFKIIKTIYEDKIILELYVNIESTDELKVLLSNITSGNYLLLYEDKKIVYI